MTDPAADRHSDYLALLDRIFERWPDMRRYADTARRERLEYVLSGNRRGWCWCVTVTDFDKRAELEAQP
jgi:hypothetical protein